LIARQDSAHGHIAQFSVAFTSGQQ